MFGRLLRTAKDFLRPFLADVGRRELTLRDWFQENCCEHDCEARGLRLLREWLSPEQRAQYDACRYFDVIGCVSGKRYRIHHGASMNVHEIDAAGHPRVGWCFVPNTYLVPGDVMLAQKIALENDERGALAVAKRFVPKETQLHMFVHL
jgi:hypothetical protein